MAALRLLLGNSNGYLIPAGDGYVLVDAGAPRVGWPLLRRALAQHGIDLHQIRLIVVTHVHFDHVGGLAAIQAASGAPVMVHAAETDLLQQGTVVIPAGSNGYGRVVNRIGNVLAQTGGLRFPPVRPDIVVENGLSVDNFGLDAQVIHTPGHSPGSLTLLVNGGDAFVGDLAANHLPWGHGPVLPPFFGDRATLEASWRRVLAAGAVRIHPGHGPAFPAQWLQARLLSH